ncbi:MAG: hypothetical protein L3J33_03440 [Rhodobacteraceae bacterium]|nr:hypothetical protein [Paracoccaceae bacterium]
MARGLQTDIKDAAAASVVNPFNLVHLAFDSGDVRLWTGRGQLSWGGETWTGAGALLKISAPNESTEVQAKGITLSLSGLPADILAIALGEDYQNRKCTVYFGTMTGGIVDADPFITFRGSMDRMPIVDSGSEATISVVVENRLLILHRSRNRRWTDADQKIDFPADKGFEYVQAIQESPIEWGKSASGGGVTSGSGSGSRNE